LDGSSDDDSDGDIHFNNPMKVDNPMQDSPDKKSAEKKKKKKPPTPQKKRPTSSVAEIELASGSDSDGEDIVSFWS
jgi:hypothetical protein